MIVNWTTQQQRHGIAQLHRERFKELYKKTGVVEEHPLVKEFRFIRGSQLLTLEKIPEYREVSSQLYRFAELDGDAYFLSHRWLSTQHPDPNGRQLAVLRQHVDPKAYYWIDYACLPQKPRTAQEEALFRQSMHMLPSLMFRRRFIVSRFVDDGYFGRAWCFFELLAAHVLGGDLSYVYESPELGADSYTLEQAVLERTLVKGVLPAHLGVTDAVDLEAIQEAAKTVTTFALINLVSHYLALGQLVSDEKYFFGEDRYYFMAACDFSKLLLWVFDALHSQGMGLFELSRDEFDENVFVRIAANREFRHNIDIYALPREVLLDDARLHWLSTNRSTKDSATNLFYLVSSMIAPMTVSEDAPATVAMSSEAATAPGIEGYFPLPETPNVQAPAEDQVVKQKWGHPGRLSIELDCPPGDPRPPEVFEMAIAGTGLTDKDFEFDGRIVFGRTEYLLVANVDAIERYRRARPTIKKRLTEFYERGLVRAATW